MNFGGGGHDLTIGGVRRRGRAAGRGGLVVPAAGPAMGLAREVVPAQGHRPAQGHQGGGGGPRQQTKLEEVAAQARGGGGSLSSSKRSGQQTEMNP
jgi:hypothetical protein